MTGRTTRLLEEAHRLAQARRAVYVVAANDLQARNMAGWYDELYPQAPPGAVKFETALSLGTLDWATMRARGAHPNVVVLADHYAIECEIQRQFGAALDQWQRFAAPDRPLGVETFLRTRLADVPVVHDEDEPCYL